MQIENLKEKYLNKACFFVGTNQLQKISNVYVGFSLIETAKVEKISTEFGAIQFCTDNGNFTFTSIEQLQRMVFLSKDEVPRHHIDSYDEFLKIKNLLNG